VALVGSLCTLPDWHAWPAETYVQLYGQLE